MAIKQQVNCDKCGEAIVTTSNRPTFPQLSWCFHRPGAQLLKGPEGEPVLRESVWMGSVSRQELCFDHGIELNALLKAYALGDSRVAELVQVLVDENERAWIERQQAVRAEYEQLKAAHDAARKESAG